MRSFGATCQTHLVLCCNSVDGASEEHARSEDSQFEAHRLFLGNTTYHNWTLNSHTIKHSADGIAALYPGRKRHDAIHELTLHSQCF